MEVEIPEIYRKFVKNIAYTFYTPIHIVILSTLTRYSIIDEDTLLDLLQIDKRQFRSAIYLLKNDKLIKQTCRKEKALGTGMTTYNFYYINYYSFINAVHFRLNRMRKNMVKEEKSAVNYATFQCKECKKQFQDIDIVRLFDMDNDEIICDNCEGKVQECAIESSSRNKTCMIARFNEQSEYFFKMIHECMSFRLDPRLIDPEITEDHVKRAEFARNNPQKAAFSIRKQFDVTGENPTYGSLIDQNLNITFNKVQKSAPVSKPLPKWLSEKPVESVQETKTQNTVDKKNILSDLVTLETEEGKVILSSSPSVSHEEKIDFTEIHDNEFNGLLNSPPDSYSCVDEAVEDTVMDNVTEIPASESGEISDKDSLQKSSTRMITVNGVAYEFHDISDEMIKSMTKEEHQKYVDILNEMYNNNL